MKIVRICEKCKKQHNGQYGSGRFCSSICARSFSTKTKRKQINQKVSLKFKSKRQNKKYYCTSCKVQKNRRSKYCDQCRLYSNDLELFKKLNVYNQKLSLKQNGRKTLNVLFNLYFNLKYSTIKIFQLYNIRSNTIFNFFKKHNIKLRSLSQSNNNYLLHNQQSKNFCSKKFKHGWHTTWDNKQVFYRSSIQLQFAKQLDQKKIPYQMQTKRFLYFDTQLNKYKIGIPDFFLPMTNQLVQLKGIYWYDQINWNDRKKAYQQQGYKVSIIIK